MQMMGMQFGLTGALQRLYISVALGAAVGDKVNFTFMDEVIVATAGGCISAITTSPFELVMIQQQLKGGSLPHRLSSLVRKHGLMGGGAFRGLTQSIMRDGIYTCGLLGITPATQNMFMHSYGCSERASGFYASIIGGVACATLSHPFDMVKTVVQGDLERKNYGSVMDAYKKLYKEGGGVKRFFNGLFWRSVNIVGTIYIANEVRVYASHYLMKKKEEARHER
jgi:hypothetical protein